MTLKLHKTLLASASLLCISLGAAAQEAEGATGTISSIQDNGAAVSSSVDFDVTADFSAGGMFSLDGEDLDGRRSLADSFGTLASTGNILSMIEFTEDNASMREFSADTSSFGRSLYDSSSFDDILTYFANNPTSAAGEASSSYRYSPVFLVPEVSGTYTIGQMSAPVDTLLYFFEGEFNPLNFSQNFIGGNDDYALYYGAIGDGGLPPPETGFSLDRCGSSSARCPGIDVDLEAGKYYTMVLSHYGSSAHDSFTFPQSVYAYGPGAAAILGSEEDLEDEIGGGAAGAVISDVNIGIINNVASSVAKGLEARNKIDADVRTAAPSGLPAIVTGASPATLSVSADRSILNAQTNSGAVTASIDGSDPATPARIAIRSNQPINSSTARIQGNSVEARAFGTDAINSISLEGSRSAAVPTIAIGSAHLNSGAVSATIRDVSMRIVTREATGSSFSLSGNSITANAIGNNVSNIIRRTALH
ncbi:MAG: hypothetical protein WBA15_03550 [Mesorhizobium sp.]